MANISQNALCMQTLKLDRKLKCNVLGGQLHGMTTLRKISKGVDKRGLVVGAESPNVEMGPTTLRFGGPCRHTEPIKA